MITLASLRDLPIKRKLTLLVLAVCSVILLLACGGLFGFQLFLFKRDAARNLDSIAAMIADNATGIVSFKDKQAAKEILENVVNHPPLVSARLDLADGTNLARAGDLPARDPRQRPAYQEGEEGAHFHGNDLFVTRRIVLNREWIGTLYIHANIHPMYHDLVLLYSTVLILVLGGSCGVALLLSARLQRFITDPIFKLAEVVRAVTEQQDYSVRAEKLSHDELGLFTDTFNQMLARIESQDNYRNRAEKRLCAQYGIARILADTWTLEAALPQILRLFGETLDWDFGAVWERETESNTLRVAAAWHRPGPWLDNFETVCRALSLAPADDFPGPAPAWISDAAVPGQCSRALHAAQANLHGAVCFPIHLDGGGLYAAEFFSHEARAKDDELLNMTEAVAGQIAQFIQRKQAEAALTRVNRQLVEASRQAGMAEVATSVLHNVGNVLNSVNVSVTVVSDRLEHSSFADLERVIALLNEHAADLGNYLSADPKGKLILEFLKQLAGQLAFEHGSYLKEMESLCSHVEHIKEIVAMQQNFAKVRGAIESIHVVDLVEDSLRLNADALERHDVRIIREYAEVAPVMTERHKVLQILINLIRNAKYACDGSSRTDKQLTLRIAHGENHVKIAVIDNGVGIPSENLNRIFNHGFTTRKDGHGFGLHSGALAARELGGSLQAYSPGLGLGATFILELPLRPIET